MNSAYKFLSRVKGVRKVAENRWVFRVPTREDKKPSGSALYENKRLLIHDFAGDTAEEMTAAVGLTVADLFDEPRVHSQPDPEVARKLRAARGLEEWRSRKLTSKCEFLQKLDRLAAETVNLMSFYDVTGTGAKEEIDAAWEHLSFAYKQITWLEFDHERLNSKKPADHLAVWRELKGVANAAT